MVSPAQLEERAFLGVEVMKLRVGEGKQRRLAKLLEGKDSSRGAAGGATKGPTNREPRSEERTARELGVGKTSLKAAVVVSKAADPALKEAVLAKKVPLAAAAKIAKLPKPEQEAAIAEAQAERADIVRSLIGLHLPEVFPRL